jgi:Gamma tubulin complex component C-terminal
MNSLYRMTRDASNPLFATLTQSNKLLLHFRSVAQTFVNAISSYVFDTAIRGNFDAFLLQIRPPDQADGDQSGTASKSFSDVFALSSLHSSVMDDILSACLLRSRQRAIGDLLRSCLELVLDLCILAGELKRKRLEEYNVAPLLEDLFSAFRGKITSLVRNSEILRCV